MELITIDKLKKYTEKLRKKLSDENSYFIVGRKDLIEQFCEDHNLHLSHTNYSTIWNITEDIIYHIGLIDKDILLNVKPSSLEINRKQLLGIRLSDKGYKEVIYILDDNSEIDLLMSLQNVICKQKT